MKLNVEINESSTVIELPKGQGKILITSENLSNPGTVNLYLKNGKLVSVQDEPVDKKFDGVIVIEPAWDLETDYLAKSFSEYALEQGMTKADQLENIKLPGSQRPTVEKFRDLILTVLNGLGFRSIFMPKKKFKGKPRHRFTKQVSQIPFHVDHDGAKATVYWQKRNEMLIKAGAVMKPDPELNKDGSLGFSARFAERLRAEHADSFDDFTTTEDIVLKSVNEVGLFLYFGGTNSWLVLKDDSGKSINEWTVVKE
ncbi:hypothetical protein [Lentilactobacillus sunkii]|uniref:Uncharacterized protein n=1 Tax=Lentilactobacillus sunkii DSM 19904 TaxID=1423808 RepID=A0A0R1L8Q9_9LACO|nr:hypothetical protein [Lentilactobacillus sunkii]KRK89604.1 hypothetical protein FD17_GL001195 [Lentilactobacillus sunkii DSM 19904]